MMEPDHSTGEKICNSSFDNEIDPLRIDIKEEKSDKLCAAGENDVISLNLLKENRNSLCNDSVVNPIDTNSTSPWSNIAESETLSITAHQNEDKVSSYVESPCSNSIADELMVCSANAQTQEVSNGSKHENIKVEIRDTKTVECVSPQSIAVQTERNDVAFNKCQKSESGTDDSESDSSSSSDSESESETSATTEKSSESDSSDGDCNLKKTSRIRSLKVPEDDGVKKERTGTRYKNEMDMEDLPPIEDLHITVLEDECEPLGTVCSIVNQLVVVESLQNKPALNLDSLLFKKDGSCLGQIFDVFGPVKTPFYTLRFNSKQDILDKGVEVGQTVYCAPQTPHTRYVFVYQLMQQKGSDASWKHNYEVPDNLRDYSDDEEERIAKRKRQQKTRGRGGNSRNEDQVPTQRKQLKSEFIHNYSSYTDNEWYQARVSEMNQFTGGSRGRHHDNKRRGAKVPSLKMEQSRGRDSFESPPVFSSPPPLIRPSIPNNWSSPSPVSASIENPFVFRGSPVTPPPTFSASPSFSCPSPFSSPPPSYEKLTSNISFSNPIAFSRPPPPVTNPWLQNQPTCRPPFRIDNTRKMNLIPPRPLTTVPHLPRPNIPLNPPRRPSWFSSQPPPPSSDYSNMPPSNYLPQPPQF